MHIQDIHQQSPTGDMPAPLIELALRVQLSGVPPAYGSWLLTPRPPLHEGEKQPVGQEGKKIAVTSHKTASAATDASASARFNTNTTGGRRSTTKAAIFSKGQGVGVGEGGCGVLGRLNAFSFFWPVRWVMIGIIGVCESWLASARLVARWFVAGWRLNYFVCLLVRFFVCCCARMRFHPPVIPVQEVCHASR